MKDEKSVELMHQYMVPNARDNGINGIEEIKIKGEIYRVRFRTNQYNF